jgi:hypothetical protein
MKVIITESQYNKATDMFITYLLEPHKSAKFQNSIYWVKEKQDLIIVQIKNSELFWLRDVIWDRISQMFSLDYDETQSVIKMWLEKHYGLGGLTPKRFKYLADTQAV